MAIEVSIDFVKKNFEKIREQLTREHQSIAKQFLDFKRKTYSKMDVMDDYHIQMKWAELALCLKNQVYEAEYLLEDENHPL